ncbi:MAG: hypothetical protein QOI53_2623 [Verrucomicrobiota bacterium]|jgi:hypothetical protein|nr:hypothetical protein [Verrucomicrobiota bacterium]
MGEIGILQFRRCRDRPVNAVGRTLGERDEAVAGNFRGFEQPTSAGFPGKMKQYQSDAGEPGSEVMRFVRSECRLALFDVNLQLLDGAIQRA